MQRCSISISSTGLVFVFVAITERLMVFRFRSYTIYHPIIARHPRAIRRAYIVGSGPVFPTMQRLAMSSGLLTDSFVIVLCCSILCVLQNHLRSTRHKIRYVSRDHDNYELWLVVTFQRSCYCYQRYDEMLNN